jgi:uncharacterized membrane protein YqaE (UPF0057 family)
LEIINRNKLGLTLGLFFAVVHAIWSILVGIMPRSMQSFINWVSGLHFLQPLGVITFFSLGKAILLVILTFVVGYIFGWIFATILNWILKKN